MHIDTVPNRMAPGMEECALHLFQKTLARSGYSGRISIEATVPDAPQDFARALQTLMATF
jgi:hydroxypyruvate isomerase